MFGELNKEVESEKANQNLKKTFVSQTNKKLFKRNLIVLTNSHNDFY